ncbi:MAG: alpha/beta hydrolase [Candidatus Nanoarchaeia archaeon]
MRGFSDPKEEKKKETIQIEKETSKNRKISKDKKQISTVLKKFFSTNRKLIKKILIITIVIFIIISAYFMFLEARFSVKQDLEVSVNTRHLNLEATKKTPAQLDIIVRSETSFMCKAECTEEIINANTKEIIYSENFTFRKLHSNYINKNLYPSILGEGQDIYVFSVSCNNIPSKNCPAKTETITKNTIITIQRKLTQDEQLLKHTQEQTLQSIYLNYNKALSYIDESSQILSSLKYAKKNDLENTSLIISKEKDEFESALLQTKETWLTRNHELMQAKLESQNTAGKSFAFESNAENQFKEIILRITDHNKAVNISFELSSELADKETALIQGKQFLIQRYPELENTISESKSLLSFSMRSIASKDFQSYSDIFFLLNNTNRNLAEFEEIYNLSVSTNPKLSRFDFDLIYAEEDNCIILGGNNCTVNMSSELFYFSDNTYDSISPRIKEDCLKYNSILLENELLRNSSLQKRINLSDDQLVQINEEEAKYRIYTLKKHKQELSERNDSTAQTAIIVINEYITLIESTTYLNESSAENNFATFNYSLFEYFLPANFTLNNIIKCETPKIKSININLSFENIPEISKKTYNSTYPELKPLCCFNLECKPCQNNPSENYPLILVHGHGFYSKNTPTAPAEIYNSLQHTLFEENLYLPAGVLNENESIITNSLGFVDAPISYKASYYPEEILNNESISLFADRLNIIIKKAKQETGKDKVVLIAHSMGGLVTREYLKKYGSGDIEKIIIVGTPNRGVTSETVAFCKLFGRNLECDEMHKDSKFILNLSKELPPSAPVFTIRGTGCSTFGADGDGIVQSSSVPLAYAQNYAFNGTCSLTGGFHTGILNPEENPEIYNKVKELLIDQND